MKNKILTIAMLSFCLANAQTGKIQGYVTSEQKPVRNVKVSLPNISASAITDDKGYYKIENVPASKQELVISRAGYATYKQMVQVGDNNELTVDVELEEDYFDLEGIVITATRKEVPVYKSPVIVSRITDKTFESTQSLTLSESLNFASGLRMETNCQNCGFNQVRMNGLEGAYSQILINSRPIFSPLMGVYGLEMLPANMIDRVEVVRGGGSVLYGGNAIAGTINVITKEPIKNTFSVGTNMSFTDYKAPDRTISASGSIVSDNLDKGMTFYAYNRDRKPWDANEDGFSEQTMLKNSTFGIDSFWEISDRKKLKLNVFSINEFRRGGDNFHLAPHQVEIAEQLDHKILGGAVSYDFYSQNYKHKYSAFLSAQNTERNSFYGGGGSVISSIEDITEDQLTAMNSYGKSKDYSVVGGLQHGYEINDELLLTSGLEYQTNEVKDQMLGYNRKIDQKVGVLGAYTQMEIKPTDKWNILLGARYDHVGINGDFYLNEENYSDKKQLNNFVPRLSVMHNLSDEWRLRASYAQGYRAPQAFDEDLHVETVGGSPSFTVLSPDLKTEKSYSYNASVNYTKIQNNFQANMVLEGFYTNLDNVFITADAKELPNGVSVLTKRNGEGAKVMGVNLETNLSFSKKWNVQFGGTIQKANYTEEEEIWSDDTETISTKDMLRTPNVYGYYSLTYTPQKSLSLSLSGVYTGSMYVPHMIDPDTEKTVIKKTKSFFEQNIKIAYDIDIKDNCIQLYTGVHNIFNSYQKDFDKGALRDSAYIYGPSRPQTLFVGASYKWN